MTNFRKKNMVKVEVGGRTVVPFKYLGVTIDTKLSWHLEYACKKAAGATTTLTRMLSNVSEPRHCWKLLLIGVFYDGRRQQRRWYKSSKGRWMHKLILNFRIWLFLKHRGTKYHITLSYGILWLSQAIMVDDFSNGPECSGTWRFTGSRCREWIWINRWIGAWVRGV